MLVYLIGRSIPIPWDAAVAEQDAEGLSALFDSILGGRAELTLFSIGLTPWIVATIAAQALNPIIRRYPGDKASFRGRLTAFFTLVLTFALAVQQVERTELLLVQGMSGPLQRSAAVIMLIAGTFCMVWLARRNEDWGIGGQRLLIVINLIDTLCSDVNTLRKEHVLSLLGKDGGVSVVVLILLILVILPVTVYFQINEYRYPLYRPMIDNRYAPKDYLAIRYNPAGTMPVMYTMALFSILSSGVSAIAVFLPAAVSGVVSAALDLRSIGGMILFLLMFRALTGLAAGFTIDPAKTADDLKRSGGYINDSKTSRFSILESLRSITQQNGTGNQQTRTSGRTVKGIHPGKATEDYLRREIRRASIHSSVVMGLIVVLPCAYGVYTDVKEIGNIAVTIIFLTGILIELLDECGMYYSMQNYRPILKIESRVTFSEQNTEETKKNVIPEVDGIDTQERKAPSEKVKKNTKAKECRTYCFVPAWEEDETLSACGARTGSTGTQRPEGAGQFVIPSIPVYDDIIHQMSMFHDAEKQTGITAELLGLSYLPQLRYFLHHHGLEDVPVCSAFDELQGIHLTRFAVLRWQDLDWKKLGGQGNSCDLIWIPSNGVMRGYEENSEESRRIFDVHFTPDGAVYYVDHYDEKSETLRVDRRSIYDDRGFLSSSVEFMNADDVEKNENLTNSPENSKITAVQRFYNPDGEEQFCIEFPKGRVRFKSRHDCTSLKQCNFRNVSDMVEIWLAVFLKKCEKVDAFFLAAQGEADDIVDRAKQYALGDRKIALSFYEGRSAQLKAEKTEGFAPSPSDAGSHRDGTTGTAEAQASGDDREREPIKQYKSVASLIVVDTEEKRQYFDQFEYGDDRKERRRVPTEVVYPYEMQSRTGRSENMLQVVIFMPADGMFDEDVPGRTSYIMKHVVEYVMKEDTNIQLWLGTEKGKGYIPEFDEKRKEWYGKYRTYRAQNAANHLDVENGWDKEDNKPETQQEEEKREKARKEARTRKNNELDAVHRRVRVVSYQTEEELEDILELSRVVLDPRTTPDLRLQAATVCYKIPQVVFAPSAFVVHTENGYVCNNESYIADGLRYYLDRLANWNRAHESCVQMIQQSTGKAGTQQVQWWMKLMEEGEAG